MSKKIKKNISSKELDELNEIHNIKPEDLNIIKNKEHKCEWINQKNEPCPWKSVSPDKLYCDAHSIYEGKYTKDDIPNMKRCTCCKNLWIPDKINKTCEKCREGRKEKRLNEKKDINNQPIKCKGATQKGTPCLYQVIDNDEYCGKHQTYKKWKELSDSGKNICKNWLRGCFEIIPSDKKSCVNCRQQEQIKENKLISLKKEKAIEFNKDNEENQMCIRCNNTVNKKNIINDKCLKCYETYRKNEDSRKPQNPLIRHLSDYKSRANNKNIKWDLSDEQANNYFNSKCFYCNKLDNYNGIDRIDSNGNYEEKNCVACCKTCNIMKGTKTISDFIKIIKYILIVNLIIDEKINDEDKKLFKFGENATYNRFVLDAKHREINNEINEKTYNLIIKQNCTYCKNQFINGCRGIDRTNATIGYIYGNIVPCCYTCNILKGILSKEDFIDHLKRIFDFKEKNIISNEKSVKEQILGLCKIVKPFEHEKFKYDYKYYKNLIYDKFSFDEVKKIKIKLEFVKTDKQKDIWNYFRRYISSLKTLKGSKLIGRQLYILIKDDNTNKYLGIISLSSDMYSCESRDRYIGWNNETKKNNLKYIMNMSTCVSIQPFGYNFNGGKLLASLAFSKEVLNYFKKNYEEPLLGITTTSLYGVSIQYDRLKNLKYLGLTKGNSSFKVSEEVTKLCKNYLKKEYNIEYKSMKKFIIVTKAFQKLNLPKEDILTDKPKGIYFGFTHEKSKQILNSLNPDINNLKFKNIQSAQEIFNWWLKRWAQQRFNHLTTTNRLKTNIDDEVFN